MDLDYCNVLYCGIDEGLLSRLQSVQNAAARLVTGLERPEHVTPDLRQLHWLPVRLRVTFKLSTLVHRLLARTATYGLPVRRVSPHVICLCVQLTPGHVYLVAHIKESAIAALPLPVLVCEKQPAAADSTTGRIEDVVCFRYLRPRRSATNR